MNFLCTEMTLDIAKASGPDGISARMLRETEEHISPSLPIFFFYLSIKSRSFPSLWKKLNIVLIPKANDNRNPSNYWTIYLSASYLWSPTLLYPMIETLQLLCLMAVKWPFVHWWYAQIVQRSSGITPGYKSYNILYTPSQNDCLLIPSISM